ncbi:MAG TPA: serine hydrolase [Euryarchaeota archaeon]|nr:serine hydrolase [Euryarchaeota archaeon]
MAAKQPPNKKKKDEIAKLKQQILPIVKEIPGSMGCYIKHIERSEEIVIEADKVYSLGNVFQLAIMVEVFRQIEREMISIDDKITLTDNYKSVGSGILQYLSSGIELSVKDLLVLMMTISDNTATDLLWKKVGVQSVNMMLRDLGFTRTNIYIPNREYYMLSLLMGEEFDGLSMSEFVQTWKNKSQLEKTRSMAALDSQFGNLSIDEFRTRYEAMYGRRGRKRFQQKRAFDEAVDNQGSPREVGTLLEKVFTGEIASPSACQRMLGIMLLQDQCSSITLELPPEVPVSGKGGAIAGTKNDAGVVYINPKSHFVIACLTKRLSQGDEDKAAQVIGRISKTVYDYYSRVNI